jgi:hypothetical protein
LFKIRWFLTIPSKTSMPLPSPLAHGHHILSTPCCVPHVNSYFHNLSSFVFLPFWVIQRH